MDQSLELVNFYKEERKCVYKDEVYSVRDNGAIFRHPQRASQPRKLDNYWTFGEKNPKTGYMQHGSHRVHIIVANAFHGKNDSKKFVVDHIDTNRCNNRVENLRWLTRLENALNNPATRKKITFLCGGDISKFINDPSCLRDITGNNQDVMWMRTVSKEEAENAYKRVMAWSQTPSIAKTTDNKTPIGEWIYTKPGKGIYQNTNAYTSKQNEQVSTNSKDILFHKSLTPNVLQEDWATPTDFPLCPTTTTLEGIKEYYNNLNAGKIFHTNQYGKGVISDFALSEDSQKLWVITDNGANASKQWGLAEIYIKGEAFVHKSLGTYFEEKGAQKYFTINQGKEWTGGDCFDDYC